MNPWRHLAASDKWVWRHEVISSSATPVRQVACDAKEDPPAHCYGLLGFQKALLFSTKIVSRNFSHHFPQRGFYFFSNQSFLKRQRTRENIIHTLPLQHKPNPELLPASPSPRVLAAIKAQDAISYPTYCYNRSLTYCVITATIGELRNRMKMMKDIFASDIGHLKCDEAHFWLNGYVNKQNCRIWSEANPQVYVETPLHPEKLTVWCALWAGGILLQKR
ncbi:hypothetical protein TNCV_84491 [Trichonephila clavipes]|nr:hypothetical protein TNCV_84491 [Trichonephila clavipes]